MKKLFTLACGALLAMSASAADFGFCDKDGKFFEEGTTLYVGYEEEELVPGVLIIYEMQSGVYYKGEAGVSYTVDAKMPEECKAAWNNVQVCAFGRCMPMPDGTYTNNGKANGGVEDLQMHYLMRSMDGSKPTEDATITAWIYKTDNPSDKKSITVNFIAKPAEEVAGIASVGADLSAPVQYFNILGVEVKNPQKGQLLIRRQGNTAQKVIF